MAEHTDTRTVRLSEAKRYALHHFKKKRPFMLWGPPGMGKSELIAGIATDYIDAGKTAALVDVRLPLWEPTDIKGIPYFDSVSGTMKWAQPAELPSAEFAAKYDIVILFLDELNGAAPAVQAAAYQLILNRQVGEYHLPDNVVVVAAGNRESDKGVTYRMPKPLSNRFLHYELRVDFNDWLEWATTNNIHPDVIGYLSFSKSDLMKFDAKDKSRAFATPRSWTFVSEMLEDIDEFEPGQISDMVVAAIGEGIGTKFDAHRKVAALLPNPTDILRGNVKDLKTTEISAMYSLATSLAYELKGMSELVADPGDDLTQEQLTEMIDNTIGFWLDHFQAEMIIMSFRMVLKYKIKIEMPKLKNWRKFYERYGDLVRKA